MAFILNLTKILILGIANIVDKRLILGLYVAQKEITNPKFCLCLEAWFLSTSSGGEEGSGRSGTHSTAGNAFRVGECSRS